MTALLLADASLTDKEIVARVGGSYGLPCAIRQELESRHLIHRYRRGPRMAAAKHENCWCSFGNADDLTAEFSQAPIRVQDWHEQQARLQLGDGASQLRVFRKAAALWAGVELVSNRVPQQQPAGSAPRLEGPGRPIQHRPFLTGSGHGSVSAAVAVTESGESTSAAL